MHGSNTQNQNGELFCEKETLHCLPRVNSPYLFYFDFFKGIYGTKGAGTTSTTPGSRSEASLWIAIDGTLWLFGGYGCDSAASDGIVFQFLFFFGVGKKTNNTN
jgi:hypothetical protein